MKENNKVSNEKQIESIYLLFSMLYCNLPTIRTLDLTDKRFECHETLTHIHQYLLNAGFTYQSTKKFKASKYGEYDYTNGSKEIIIIVKGTGIIDSFYGVTDALASVFIDQFYKSIEIDK